MANQAGRCGPASGHLHCRLAKWRDGEEPGHWLGGHWLGGRLAAAVEQATVRLDEIIATDEETITVTVDINVRGRVIHSAADVEALIEEIRARLLAQLDGKQARTRLRLK